MCSGIACWLQVYHVESALPMSPEPTGSRQMLPDAILSRRVQYPVPAKLPGALTCENDFIYIVKMLLNNNEIKQNGMLLLFTYIWCL